MAAQHRLHIFLGNPVGQFGRTPGARHLANGFHSLRGGGQRQAGQFMVRQPGEVRNVGGVVRRQAQRANFLHEAQSPVVLHGARLRGVGLRVESRRGFGVDQQAVDAARAELVGQHQATGAAADDENLGVNHEGLANRVVHLRSKPWARKRSAMKSTKVRTLADKCLRFG